MDSDLQAGAQAKTYAIGHLALGYLFAKGCERGLKLRMNLPAVFVLSLIPDADLLVPSLAHRGATHSIIVAALVFLPLFFFLGWRSVPYFASLLQHDLVGDLLTARGDMLLWPVTSSSFGIGIPIQSATNVSIEIGSFILALSVLVVSGDLVRLIEPHKSNLLLLIPSGVILASFLFGVAGEIAPTSLLIPHISLLLLFVLSMVSFFSHRIGRKHVDR